MQFHRHDTPLRHRARALKGDIEAALDSLLALDESSDPSTDIYADIDKIDELYSHIPSPENIRLGFVFSDLSWHDALEPFVRIHPPIIRMIQNTTLAIPSELISLPRECGRANDHFRVNENNPYPLRAVAFEFPVGHEPLGVSSFSFASTTFTDPDNGELCSVFLMQAQQSDRPEMVSSYITPSRGTTIESALETMTYVGSEDGSQILEFCFRCAIVCLFVDRDNPDSIMQRCVLAKHRHEFKRTLNPKYIQKAEKRKVVGWEIGADLETTPHFRKPHFAIRWTGKGAEIPKLVPVKGCLVNYSNVKVPEGHHLAPVAPE